MIANKITTATIVTIAICSHAGKSRRSFHNATPLRTTLKNTHNNPATTSASRPTISRRSGREAIGIARILP